jgi:hypothetical protein
MTGSDRPGAPLGEKVARAQAWLGSESARRSALRFATERRTACIHCYLAVLAVELVLRNRAVRLVERSLVTLNLACWVLAPWLPLRNTTLGKHQVAIAHHVGLPVARWLGLKWFTTRKQGVRVRARVAAEIIGSDAWEIDTAAKLLAGLSCRRRCTPKTLATLVARRYNPYHPEYETLIRSALKAALETFADSGYLTQCEDCVRFGSHLDADRCDHLPMLMWIPNIGLVAEVEAKGLSQDHQLAPPDHPYCVVWYVFTARPGSQGRSLLAAPRQWRGIGPAAFCRLDEVGVGALILLQTECGRDLRYRILSEHVDDVSDCAVGDLLKAGPEASLTLIDLAGSSGPPGSRRGTRLVARAEHDSSRLS